TWEEGSLSFPQPAGACKVRLSVKSLLLPQIPVSRELQTLLLGLMRLPLHCSRMSRLAFFVVFLFAGLSSTHAQWQIEESHTAADLRGIHALGNGIAWASGSEGTVLRTTDSGVHWQRCATPPGAEHLDFRGIQAFDDTFAIVMSSGKAPLSRLYQTTDACQTWTLLFT